MLVLPFLLSFHAFQAGPLTQIECQIDVIQEGVLFQITGTVVGGPGATGSYVMTVKRQEGSNTSSSRQSGVFEIGNNGRAELGRTITNGAGKGNIAVTITGRQDNPKASFDCERYS